MSRPLTLPPLPPLEEIFTSLSPVIMSNRLEKTVEIIQQVALLCRQEESRPFYSMRDFERVLGVPLRTIAIAFERLEAAGLLLRLRGSHTRLLGKTVKPTAPITSVVGWLENIFILRHYLWRRSFTRSIGDSLRKHHLATDIILHWEYEDREYDLVDRVLLHLPDAAVWFHPFRPTRETIATLRDHGIRNLIVADHELMDSAADIVIDWEPAYRATLEFWQRQYQIKKVILVEGSPHSMHRLRRFESLALEFGIGCESIPASRHVASQILAMPKLSACCGIVLLDEWAAVDISLREPMAFQALIRRHRILYGREVPSIPYLEPKQFEFDLLRYPVEGLHDAIRDRLLQWVSGDFRMDAVRLEAKFSFNWLPESWM